MRSSLLALTVLAAGWSSCFDCRAGEARLLELFPITSEDISSNDLSAGFVLISDGAGGVVWVPYIAPVPTVSAGVGTDWRVDGNTGTTGGTDYLGTGDNQPLDIRVNATRAFRFEPTSGTPNVVGGDSQNTVTSGTVGATISGGGKAAGGNRVTDDYGTVGGGYGNRAGNNAGSTSDRTLATVGGGYQNTASGFCSTLSGGYRNVSSDYMATLAGGYNGSASGFASTVGGGYQNMATGYSAVAPGGIRNWATGNYSFAAGRRAKANHQGAFAWADSLDFNFASLYSNEFAVRATGGARFVTAVDGGGVPSRGLKIVSGQNALDTLSIDPLDIQVNGQRALRLQYHATSPNVIGGHPDNNVGTALRCDNRRWGKLRFS